MENRQTGQWFAIRLANIDLFQKTLNLNGIRERKLYDKILYYKQLGYIKTDEEDPLPE